MNKLLFLVYTIIIAGCANQKQITSDRTMANEPFIVYKTKSNYNQNVPVILNDTKTVIVSYPAPSDLKLANELRLPTELSKGYLLDNKGIGINVAFTSYTYEEYATLDVAPSIDQLMNRIIDKDPLVELYDCKDHLAIKHDLKKVNKLVKSDLGSCLKVK